MRDRGRGRPRGAPPRARDRRRHARAGPPGRARARRRRRRRGRVPHRRGGDHRGEPAHRQGRRLGDDRRQRQPRRTAADRKQRRGDRDPLGEDLPLGARRAFASQPAAARRRPGGRHVRAPRPRPRRADGPLLGELASLRRGAAGRARGAGGRLPVRGGPRRSACDLARHRTPGALRLPRSRPRRARGPGAHAAHRLRQDRHADVGQGAHRRHRERGGGERRGARTGSRAGAPFRARAGARDRQCGRGAGDRGRSPHATFGPCPAAAFAAASTASLWRPGTAP